MNILILSSQAEPNQSAYQLISWEWWNTMHAYSRNAGAYKIASEMRRLGHNVEVVDFITYWSDDKFKQFIDSRIDSVDVVGWSSQFFFNFDFYHQWSDYIKSVNPNITFITGGPKVANLLNFTKSKYLIAGYAEDAIIDVLGHIEGTSKKLKFKIVNDQYYVDCLEFYKMQTLPAMNIDYHDSDYIIPSETLTIGASRGCVFKCSFCTYPYIGKNKNLFNREGAQTYYDEFMNNYERWGVTNYFLSDETANDSIDKLKDIEAAAEKLPFKLSFTGFVRLDLMTRQKANWEIYKNIGFTNWHFGIESFNPESLKAMTKGFDPKILQQTLFELRDYFKDEALIYASFIVGAPYDTPKTFEELTIDWLRNEGRQLLDGKTFFPLNIHKESLYAVGSELSRNYQAYGYYEMTPKQIAYEMSVDPSITKEHIEETKKYNTLWATDHWNIFSVERYSNKYRKEICFENNLGPWVRAKIISVGVPADQINQLRNPSNHKLFQAFEEKLPGCLSIYIDKKISKVWF